MLKDFKGNKINDWSYTHSDTLSLERLIGKWMLRFELFREWGDDYYCAREIEISRLGKGNNFWDSYTFDSSYSGEVYCEANNDLDLMLGDLMDKFEDLLEYLLDEEENISDWEFDLLYDFLHGEKNNE